MRAVASRLVSMSVCAVAVASVCGVASGQTVPGERWKQKISVSMDGMTMQMGGGEICAPVGRTEDLMKPDEDCTTSNVRVVGDTTSADVTCTGEDAMSGTVRLTKAGNTVSGKANMTTEDGEEMVLLMESTKLGPCQAMDTAAVAASAGAMPGAQPDFGVCSGAREMFAQDPAKAGAMAQLFVERGQPCATTPADPAFCAAVQTRRGFSGLIQADAYLTGVAGKSATACGLGQGAAGLDALRAGLVQAAEADGDGEFLIAHAPARAQQLARSECELKGEMWGGKTAKWDSFCDSNFAAEARDAG